MFVNAVVIFAFISFVNSNAVPITKCQLDDSKCIKQNTKVLIPLFSAGIPELGIEPLEPLFFSKIDASNDLLNLVFKDLSIKGLNSCKFKNIELKTGKPVISGTVQCHIVLDGKYTMKGQIFLLPVAGDGKAHIEHEKIEISFDQSYKEETGADGKKHWVTGAWSHSFKYVGKSKLELDNLFGGNEVLATATKQLLKERPNELSEFMAPPIVKTIVAKILKNVKKFFEKIPVEDFALN